MFGWLKNLFKKVFLLILLVLAAYAGWRWGAQVFPKVNEWLGLGGGAAADPVPTQELADSVLEKIRSFRSGNGPDQLALGGNDLTSVLRFSVPGMMPSGVSDPRVSLGGGRVRFKARVALEAFPELPDLGGILGFLPDTLDVELDAAMMPFGEGSAALLVHRIEAAGIPLPGRLVPEILKAMGREARPGLPEEAFFVPLPSGLGSAYILTDSLILSHDP